MLSLQQQSDVGQHEPPGTQTLRLTGSMTSTGTITLSVGQPDMFDRFRDAESAREQKWAGTKKKSTRTPRQATPRMDRFKIPVNVPDEAGNYRAELCAWASFLPPHLSSVMKGAICASDAGGEPAHTGREAISAYTHTPGIQKRYDCKPVSLWQVEDNLPTLAKMGLVTTTSRKFYDAWDRKFKTEFTLTITDENIDNLEAIFHEGVAAKAAREAEKAERKVASDARRNRWKREKRARQTVVESLPGNSWHTADSASGSASGPVSGSAHIAEANQVAEANRTVPTHHQDRAEARDDDGGMVSRGAWDESWHRARMWLAVRLGVSPEEIGWNAVTLASDLNETYGRAAVADAAHQSRERGDNAVAYFVGSAESMCAGIAAEQQAQADEEQADEQDTQTEPERQDDAQLYADQAEREAAEAERKAAEAECEKLMPDYVALWWEESGPARAHYHADFNLSTTHPRDRLEHMRESIAAVNEAMAGDPEYAERARPGIARMRAAYIEWSATRAAEN